MRGQGSRFTGLPFDLIWGGLLVTIGLVVLIAGVAVASAALFIVGVIDLIVGAMLLGSDHHRR